MVTLIATSTWYTSLTHRYQSSKELHMTSELSFWWMKEFWSKLRTTLHLVTSLSNWSKTWRVHLTIYTKCRMTSLYLSCLYFLNMRTFYKIRQCSCISCKVIRTWNHWISHWMRLCCRWAVHHSQSLTWQLEKSKRCRKMCILWYTIHIMNSCLL
jgi:hypothetical protein